MIYELRYSQITNVVIVFLVIAIIAVIGILVERHFR